MFVYSFSGMEWYQLRNTRIMEPMDTEVREIGAEGQSVARSRDDVMDDVSDRLEVAAIRGECRMMRKLLNELNSDELYDVVNRVYPLNRTLLVMVLQGIGAMEGEARLCGVVDIVRSAREWRGGV